jgi:hypothetical protein
MTSMRALKLKRAGWIGLCALLAVGMAQADSSILDSPGSVSASSTNASSATDADSDFNNVEIVDAALNAKLSLLRIGSRRASNNLLSVFAGLKNRTDHRLVLEVETIYKDKTGNELNTGSWIRLTLKPHEDTDYRSSSISEAAVDFLIRVRRPPAATASAQP